MTPPDAGEHASRPRVSAVQGPRRLRTAGLGPDLRTSERLPNNNLPLELTSFIGRGREVAEVKGLVGDNRLLTLTGPGGCGKTRLALAVAFEVASSFEDGVWWVGLASISGPDLVPQMVAQVLEVREQPHLALTETLADSLHEKQLLLVLETAST